MALIKSSEPTPRAEALEAGDPVPALAVTQQGSTFAERAAAAKKAEAKAVKPDDVEDKAVSSSDTKARSTRKKA